MKSLTLLATAFLIVAPLLPAGAKPVPPATTDVRELKRRLAEVTAEAEALWTYVESGPDNPDIRALNRASELFQRRRARK